VNCRNRYFIRSWLGDEEGEEGVNMLEHLLVVGWTKEPIKSKKNEHMHATTSQDQRSLKTLHHQVIQRRRESRSKKTSITQ